MTAREHGQAHDEHRAPSTTTTRRDVGQQRAERHDDQCPEQVADRENACSLLITGRRRACSTLTPRAFIATSIAPLPRPKIAAPRTQTGRSSARAHQHHPDRHHGSPSSEGAGRRCGRRAGR